MHILRFVLVMVMLPGLLSDSCMFPEFSHRNEDAKRWMLNRFKTLPHNEFMKKSWPTQGSFRLQNVDDTVENYSAKDVLLEELTNWLHNNGFSSVQRKTFTYVYLDAVGDVETKFNYGWMAHQDLNLGTSLINLREKLCISDGVMDGVPRSLMGAPWEIRLATNLLREREKGALSRWSVYIRTLPRLIGLPIFFSNMELESLQDAFIKDEIFLMRKFLVESFQALQQEEKAGAKFKEFAWAMSIVYSSSCQLKKRINERMVPTSKHFLIPIFSSFPEPEIALAATSWNMSKGTLSLVVNHAVIQGTLLATNVDPNCVVNSFLFHGHVPISKLDDRAKVFKSLEELVDWYSSVYLPLNSNRYLTLTVANDAIDMLRRRAHFVHSSTSNLSVADFSVGADGYVDPYTVCVLASLYSAKKLIQLSRSNILDQIEFSMSNFDNNERTLWESRLLRLATISLTINVWKLSSALELGGDVALKQAFEFVAHAIQLRVRVVVESYSTDLQEDNLLLQAAMQEGLNYEDRSHGCPGCRWQTEELSVNDILAVRFRIHKKTILQQFQSLFKNEKVSDYSGVSAVLKEMKEVEDAVLLQTFLTWCRGQEFKISGKLAVMHISSEKEGYFPKNHSGVVRGIVATQDIQQGEILCILKLAAGLYHNVSSGNIEMDGWDLAAARLLQEKALGNNSKWAPYIAVLPTNMATPITLESSEMDEVQWWPTIRELIQVRQAIKESYQSFKRRDIAWATFDEYRWACIMVHSRAFTLPVLDEEKYAHYVLMPYMDMINHHFHYQADWISRPIVDGKLEIVAKRQVRKGEQLFASFGPRSNDNLFLYYGFILPNNPYDSANVFSSFDEGVRWFLDVWTSDCIHLLRNTSSYKLCTLNRWKVFLPQARAALEDGSSNSMVQSKDWWELVGRWSDYGSQYVSYQPNPSVYISGIVDPSLLAVFTSIGNVSLLADKTLMPNLNSLTACKADDCDSEMFSRQNLKKFFRCMENLENPFYQPLLSRHHCQGFLVSVLRAQKVKVPLVNLVARISVALRCLELLSSFPTTQEEDLMLLESTQKGRTMQFKGKTYRTGDGVSPSIHLARQYRYTKKLLLRSVIDAVLKI